MIINATGLADDDPVGAPLIGYDNVMTTANITTTTEDEDFPASNMANPATHLKWVGGVNTAMIEYVTISGLAGQTVNYLAVAKHNFGTDVISASVEGTTSDSPESWTTLVSASLGDATVLLHCDGVDASTTITDDGTGSRTWTANGNAQIDTSDFNFGGASLLLDGTGDYVSTPDSSDFVLGSDDFTIDMWFKCDAAGGTDKMLAGQSTGSNIDCAFTFKRNSSNVLTATVFVGTPTIYSVTGTTQFTNALNTGWHHVALVRASGFLKLFVDGVQEGSSTAIAGSINDSTQPLWVGNESFTNAPWQGWIDEFRFTPGTARWTANFTPPTAAAESGNLITDDSPLLFRWESTSLTKVRLRLQYLLNPPEIAVLYVGELLVLERSIDIGPKHVPITYGRRTTVVNGMSESGNFLGRIVLGETRQSKAEFEWFTPDFYRSDIDAFLEAAQEAPFFWAWSPDEYPDEVGYVWLTNNAEPETDPATRRVGLQLDMRGVA